MNEKELQEMHQIINVQQLFQEIQSRKTSMVDSTLETFPTHNNIIKRLKALQELQI
jgi:hypothetical protein